MAKVEKKICYRPIPVEARIVESSNGVKYAVWIHQGQEVTAEYVETKTGHVSKKRATFTSLIIVTRTANTVSVPRNAVTKKPPSSSYNNGFRRSKRSRRASSRRANPMPPSGATIKSPIISMTSEST